ncbi:NmrA family NAD(P)-binding protein [Curvibacter sp. APW13]|uniref:NmrA family NAD(P)-binding protein n=1 Tax=Curvibacter sp. APW13 TaxID=3077236 RepID=UPI0028DFDF43|nr:NAD-dependent epimerase/dehydratase family protein [Curvibacter sp. APW13]MDT8990847.1 NmrA family NAD(P)-binding protein [Curvibacter sp. APW13]
MSKRVLILGARGRFGLSVARAFAAAGWQVFGQVRPGAKVPSTAGIEWLATDIHDTEALCREAGGAQVVVHALNPAYTLAAWQAEVLPLTEAALAIAHGLGATLMVPGNVYNYGSDAPTLLKPDTPQQADTVLGRLRVVMEERLAASTVQTVVVRAGNFFGQGTGSWFDTVMAKELPKGILRYPGAPGVHTAWAYLPDLAQAFVRVAEKRSELGTHAVLHFAGHNLCASDWQAVLAAPMVARGWLAEGRTPAVKALPAWMLRLAGWFSPVMAALHSMRHLWQRPYGLDNYALVRLIGPEPRTPLVQAASAAVAELHGAVPSTENKAVTVAA